LAKYRYRFGICDVANHRDSLDGAAKLRTRRQSLLLPSSLLV